MSPTDEHFDFSTTKADLILYQDYHTKREYSKYNFLVGSRDEIVFI